MTKLIAFTGLFFALSAGAGMVDPVTVTVDGAGTKIVANADHLTVYTYDKDSGSTSNCYNGCAKAWPPVLLGAQDQVQSPLGITTRTDGSLQLTIAGKPVYLYAGDDKEGDTNGDGLGGIWHIVPATQIGQ